MEIIDRRNVNKKITFNDLKPGTHFCVDNCRGVIFVKLFDTITIQRDLTVRQQYNAINIVTGVFIWIAGSQEVFLPKLTLTIED